MQVHQCPMQDLAGVVLGGPEPFGDGRNANPFKVTQVDGRVFTHRGISRDVVTAIGYCEPFAASRSSLTRA